MDLHSPELYFAIHLERLFRSSRAGPMSREELVAFMTHLLVLIAHSHASACRVASALFEPLSEGEDIYKRIALTFLNYADHYCARVGFPGVGRGNAPEVSPPRRLKRSSAYGEAIRRSRPGHDQILYLTGFPGDLFDEFVEEISPRIRACLPERRDLTIPDRLVLFFFRCRRNLSLGQIEAVFGVSTSVAHEDFHGILTVLHSWLVVDEGTKIIDRWPYPPNAAVEGREWLDVRPASRHLSPHDQSEAAKRWRRMNIQRVVGAIDGIMIEIVRPATPMTERLAGVNRQQEMFSGYKRLTALVFLVVTDLQGRILGMFGPYPGRHNDRGLYMKTPLFKNWKDCFQDHGGALYADGGFSGEGRLVFPWKRNQISDNMRGDVRRGRKAHNAETKWWRSVVEHTFSCKLKWDCIRFPTQIVHMDSMGMLVKTLFGCVRWMQDRGHSLPRRDEYFKEQKAAWDSHSRDQYD